MLTHLRLPAVLCCAVLSQVLDINGIKYQRQEAFVLMCADEKKQVHFEMEICKMPRLSMHGIKHRRIGGDSVSYKDVCSKVLGDMHDFLGGGAPMREAQIRPPDGAEGGNGPPPSASNEETTSRLSVGAVVSPDSPGQRTNGIAIRRGASE